MYWYNTKLIMQHLGSIKLLYQMNLKAMSKLVVAEKELMYWNS